MQVRDRLIVALDFNTAEAAAQMTDKLRGHVGMFKVGMEAFTAEGPKMVRQLIDSGEKVFLDLKFHDIPNTVHGACRVAAAMGVTMLNVHALGGNKMMRAAIEGATEGAAKRGVRPIVLAVTILTSLTGDDLDGLGIEGPPESAVLRLARMAQSEGLDGVVASAKEVSILRRECGPDFLIVTPGIRPAGVAANDQSRIATPQAALDDGADYLVVGRPITAAPDPAAAAEAILEEMKTSSRFISPTA
ncbi:MAG TPA: orotidine-5'-phosphate decarboxylase [Terriglobia bacterium]|nr:orotidine-5'-phosphate decarboxylase [Terriglobia bacterium]